MTGWLGYAALFAIVFARRPADWFFLPVIRCCLPSVWVAGAGQLNMFAINALLIVAAVVGDATGYFLGAGRAACVQSPGFAIL
jgi:membrane protein DedA with SNARE-associated domain